MQKRQVPRAHVVKVDLDVLPPDLGVVGVDVPKTLRFVVDDMWEEHLLRRLVKAIIILPSEQVDAHDAEDEPEDETHQQHVHDGGYGAYQGIHHHLRTERKEDGKFALAHLLEYLQNGNVQKTRQEMHIPVRWFFCPGEHFGCVEMMDPV